MKTYHEYFATASWVIMLCSMSLYLWSILKTKETKLSPASWFIFMVLSYVNLEAYLTGGEKGTSGMLKVSAVNCTVLFILSLKFKESGWHLSDTLGLILASIAIALRITTGNPLIALCTSLTADSIGIGLMVLKARRDPFSENLLSWITGFAASACNLIAITKWSWTNGIYNIYFALSYVLIIIPLVRGQLFLSKKYE